MSEIPIIDRDRNTVARIDWTGGLFIGKGKVKADREHADEAKRIRETIAQRRDLEQIQFRARNTVGYTKGWHGFEGTLQALNIALPTIGFYVDWERIDWPVGSEKLDSEEIQDV